MRPATPRLALPSWRRRLKSCRRRIIREDLMRIGAAFMFCVVCGTASAQPNILEFSGAGICNASAAIAIDENRIMVGDDEKSLLPIFDLPNLRFLESIDFGGGE